MNGLETATSGDIIIDGFNLTDKNTNLNLVRQNVGMVFQHFNLFPNMTVLQNITYAPIELKNYLKMMQMKSHAASRNSWLGR